MTVIAFKRRSKGRDTTYLGPSSNVNPNYTEPFYVFCVNLDSDMNDADAKRFVSEIYMSPQTLMEAKAFLIKLIQNRRQKREITEKVPKFQVITTFKVMFCFPVESRTDNVNKASAVFTHEPVQEHELMITDENIPDNTLKIILSEMQKKGFPVNIIRKDASDPNGSDPFALWRKAMYLAFKPPFMMTTYP